MTERTLREIRIAAYRDYRKGLITQHTLRLILTFAKSKQKGAS